jgi:hypothetical protein
VVAVLAKDSVETRKESEETRVELSVAGTDVAKVLPSKTIVGFAAVVALAEEGSSVRAEIVSKLVINRPIAFFALDAVAAFITDDMVFPSKVLLANEFNSKPLTTLKQVPTGCEKPVKA